jgi:hypothetical protein
MHIILPALSVSTAAFFIWLTIRIVNRRDRWAKWAAAGLILLVVAAYPLSMGPVLVFAPDLRIRADDFSRFYYPIYWVSYRSKIVDEVVFDWYCEYVWQDRFVSLWLECFGEI